MSWAQGINQRIKVALLLGLVLLAVLVNNLWERNNIEELDHSFSSMYEDRLVPSTYLFKLTSHLYQKRLLWAEAERPGQAATAAETLSQHDAAIGVLVKEFEATYLVDEERRALRGFKARWAAGRELEQQWSARPSNELRLAMTTELDQALHQLGLLSQIQEQVGRDLKKGSSSMLASSDAFRQLEIALMIIVGLLIQALVLATRSRYPFEPANQQTG